MRSAWLKAAEEIDWMGIGIAVHVHPLHWQFSARREPGLGWFLNLGPITFALSLPDRW